MAKDDKPFGKEWIADKLNVRDDAAKDDRDIHAIMAHMESELLNLPDYATARFKALLAELKAKL